MAEMAAIVEELIQFCNKLFLFVILLFGCRFSNRVISLMHTHFVFFLKDSLESKVLYCDLFIPFENKLKLNKIGHICLWLWPLFAVCVSVGMLSSS